MWKMADDQVIEVKTGLTSSPKYFPNWYNYYEKGDFDEIKLDPGFYRDSAEKEVLTNHLTEMIGDIEKPCILMDLGSGSCSVAKMFIDAILKTQKSLLYLPVDLDAATMLAGLKQLQKEYGDKLTVAPIVGTYKQGIRALSDDRNANVLVWFNSILNESHEDQVGLIRLLAKHTEESDRIIITVDTTMDPQAVQQAYRNNLMRHHELNVLRRLNKEYANNQIDLSKFKSTYAFVQNTDKEMISFTRKTIVSLCDQTIPLPGLGMELSLEKDEPIYKSKWLGNSHKYTLEQFSNIVDVGGMRILKIWQDNKKHAGVFSLTKK